MKRETSKWLVASAALLSLGATAAMAQLRQTADGTSGRKLMEVAERKSTPADRHRAMAEFKAKHPLLFKAKVGGKPSARQLRDVRHIAAVNVNAVGKEGIRVPFKAQSAPLGRELWGNVLQSSRWLDGEARYGIYSFGTSASMSANELYTSPYMYANAGGALSGDRLDIITYDSYYGSLIHYCFDSKTGDYVGGSYLSDYSLWSTETAVAADGKVYGDFYSADASQYELGVVDYSADSRTTIGTLRYYYVALGITKGGVLYGVAVDGNLYRIDTATAKETLVGPTGVNVLNADGSWNSQSGEIDQSTDIFYWACTDSNNNSALYTVDLATGQATKVGDMAGNEQMVLLTVPEETVEAGAPAMTQNFSVAFDKASLSGTVSFSAPTTTYMGAALSGNLNYTVTVDDKTVKTGTTTAGEQVSVPVTASRGNRLFAVAMANASGSGPRAYTTRFVGDDTPATPTGVKASLDAASGKVRLVWDAVTRGVNDGYVGDITYSVTRYPGKQPVATNLAETNLNDVLPSGGDLTGYYYEVAAVSGSRKGSAGRSNSVTYGKVLEPPYAQGFDNEGSLNLFTIIDANGDGNTWKFCDNDGSGQSAVQMEYGDENHDDWLITPPLYLKKGVLYNISYRVASKGPSYPELLEVKYGSEPTAEAMVHELVEQEEIINQQYVTVKRELVPEEDGVVYFGFHCTSDANWCYQLVLDDITVAGNSQKAPDAISELAVTPAANGENKATVTFVAPSKAIDGSALTSDLTVRILRDGTEVQRLGGVEPGKTYSCVDSNVPNGFNTYSAVAGNSEGEGREGTQVTAYVGVDVPDAPENIKASVGDNSITLTWDAVTKGANGGYVDTDDLYYSVYEIHETSTGVNLPLVDEVEEPAITIPYNINEGAQDMINYALSSGNSVGEGPRVMSPGILVGRPYGLPFEEHFKGGALDNAMWWVSRTGQSEIQLMQGMSSDGDGGCSGYASLDGNDSATLGSGKICLDGATSPMLVFSHMTASDNPSGKVTVYIQKPDQSSAKLCDIDCGSFSGKQWHTSSAAIGSEYVSLPYVTFTFVVQAPTGQTLYFDNIGVRDMVAKDLRASLSVPAKVRKGETVTATVGIANMGSAAVPSYTVNLYANGKLADSKVVDEPLGQYEQASVKLACPTSVTYASPLKLKAEVELDGDANPDDNVADADVELVVSTKTAPSDVKATTDDGKTVSVEWTKVTETSETVTDDFEAYTPWSTDEFGDWTSVYGQKGVAKGPFSRSYPHPAEGKRFAYTVVEPATWLPSDVLDIYSCIKPHSGNRYLASFYSVENSQYIPADNWLISPSLAGDEQTVCFWANSFKSEALDYPETFEVLYSTSGTTVDDFKPTGVKATVSGGEWTQYSAKLPAGATYFAIHNTTEDTYMFMVDDITYTAGCGKVVAYNIYRDGERIAQVGADEVAAYTDHVADGGSHVYGVSAVYAGGESEPVYVSPITAIVGVDAAVSDAPFDVYTADGCLVRRNARSLKGLPAGAYVVAGRTIVIK